MKTSSVNQIAILFSLFCFFTSPAFAATQISINPSFSVFSGTNLVVLKQLGENQKSLTNWPAIVTLLIATMVALVGIFQYCLASDKLRLDLFDRRFAVYQATKKFLETSLGKPKIDSRDREILRNETQVAVFLFNDDIVEYIDSLYKKTSDLEALEQKRVSLPAGSEHKDLIEQEDKMRKEFNDERSRLKDAKVIFSRYLGFKTRRWPFLRFKGWK